MVRVDLKDEASLKNLKSENRNIYQQFLRTTKAMNY